MILLTCAALAAGAPAHSPLSRRRSTSTFSFPAAIGSQVLYDGDRVHVAVGISTLVYLRPWGRSVTPSTALTESLVLRFENVELVQQLGETARRGRARQHRQVKFLARPATTSASRCMP
jgi:hypothetical protein